MIYQTDFITESADLSGIDSDIGVKLHGAAMGLVESKYAELFHTKDYHPFSIFTVRADDRIIIRVSALNDEARCVIDGFRSVSELTIYGLDKPLRITEHNTAPPTKADTAGELIKCSDCRMVFATPAMFKSGGKVCFFPELARYFYSAVCKYNKFENAELSFEEFRSAFSEGDIMDYELRSGDYNVSGIRIRGMTGFVDYRFPKNRAGLVKRVLAYTSYCGAGGKTGMGMGGFLIT